MVELYLARNEQTGRALHAEDRKVIGRFSSIAEAASMLGRKLFNACDVRFV